MGKRCDIILFDIKQYYSVPFGLFRNDSGVESSNYSVDKRIDGASHERYVRVPKVIRDGTEWNRYRRRAKTGRHDNGGSLMHLFAFERVRYRSIGCVCVRALHAR